MEIQTITLSIVNHLGFRTMLKFCELETDVSKDAQIFSGTRKKLLHSYFQPKAAQSLIANVLGCVQERNTYINNKIKF